jgi:hypothetical protein
VPKKKSFWEYSPYMFIVVSVVAGVTTAVVAAALQKWWGLKLQEAKLREAQLAQASS